MWLKAHNIRICIQTRQYLQMPKMSVALHINRICHWRSVCTMSHHYTENREFQPNKNNTKIQSCFGLQCLYAFDKRMIYMLFHRLEQFGGICVWMVHISMQLILQSFFFFFPFFFSHPNETIMIIYSYICNTPLDIGS